MNFYLPPAAIEQAARAIYESGPRPFEETYDEMAEQTKDELCRRVALSVTAALEAMGARREFCALYRYRNRQPGCDRFWTAPYDTAAEAILRVGDLAADVDHVRWRYRLPWSPLDVGKEATDG